MPKKQTRSAKDYEQLGRVIENVYEYNYANRWRLYKMSFIKGIVAGFGGVVGATVVVAIVLWALSLFHEVPFVHTITDNFQNTVQTHGR